MCYTKYYLQVNSSLLGRRRYFGVISITLDKDFNTDNGKGCVYDQWLLRVTICQVGKFIFKRMKTYFVFAKH